MTKKLVLKKQTIDNLNRGEMQDLKAGDPGCHFPTLKIWECNTIKPTQWTCYGATCVCQSIWPVPK